MNFSPSAGVSRARGPVAALLGPTNTGKTHHAIERMLECDTGMIGLPLRLLAREVYARVVEKVGPGKAALITGEEKIVPVGAAFYVCTVEAMPRDLAVDFVAVDEVQLAADLDRGHVFTDRILNFRGEMETLLLGADTIRPLLQKLVPGISFQHRPRLSQLTYAGSKKISRLPPRSAVVAFSAAEVYAIAELIRRQKGGAAVVLGALSPRTRNAQVALYQNGDVDYLVATDAIGMGLNLDVDHIAFAQSRKFDGFQDRALTPAELAQVAGRAGRYMRDGTFGVTGRQDEFEPDLVQRLEAHDFAPLERLQWRNSALDFSSLKALLHSLAVLPNAPGLTRAPRGDDQAVLDFAARDPDILDRTRDPAALQRLWAACQIPDYRKLSTGAHAELCLEIAGFLLRSGTIPDAWLAAHIEAANRLDGDIDTLSTRLAHMRTWAFIANRPDWVSDPAHWRGRTRALEDQLSDALHQQLEQRFVDRRTSLLMRRLRDQEVMEAHIDQDGAVSVEGQKIGELHGFRFTADASADAETGKTLRAAAAKVLGNAINARAQLLAEAPNDQFILSSDNVLRWKGQEVARLYPGESEIEPELRLQADEHLSGAHREWVEARLKAFLRFHITQHLKPLFDLRAAENLEGMARGIAFQLVESLGILDRMKVAADVKALEQPVRAAMRSLGVRFGAYHIYMPAILKPKPRALAAQLWFLKRGEPVAESAANILQLALSGRTSWPADASIDPELYRILGYKLFNTRAVRVDILERLADLIRPILSWRDDKAATPPPAGRVGRGFAATVEMTSLLGSSGEDMAHVLRGLGYVSETKQRTDIDAQIKTERDAYYAKQAPVEALASTATTADISTEVPQAEPSIMEVSGEMLQAKETAPAEVEQTPAEESASAADEQTSAKIKAEEQKREEATAVSEAAAEAPKALTEKELPATIDIWHFARPQRKFDRPKRDSKRPAKRDEKPQQAAGDAVQRPNDGERKRFDKDKPRDRNEKRPFKKDRGKDKERGGRDGPREKMSERRLVFSTETKNERAIDPNNPFAALAALKNKMDEKAG